jgi:hypothetical protein
MPVYFEMTEILFKLYINLIFLTGGKGKKGKGFMFLNYIREDEYG